MARTENSEGVNELLRECALPLKTPRDAALRRRILLQPIALASSAPAAPRLRSCMRALFNIRRYKCTLDVLIKKAPLVRLVREIA